MFNQNTRTKNVARTMIISVGCNFVNTLIGFAYRTVFLQILSTTYLGINGLFTNILQILSLADLGIATAIMYRFYEPVSRRDIQKVGELVCFLKHIYAIIAMVIFGCGMLLFPFLSFLIKDVSDVPADVNLHLLYVLYLVQSVSSYICSYKHTLLRVDQRQYVLSMLYTGIKFVTNALQIIALILLKDFTISLCVSIVTTLIMNVLISAWVTRLYRPICLVRTQLSKEERKEIYADTKSTMMHKIGGTVLNGTDNIILSKFVGLAVAGLYSNYYLITSSLNTILTQLLGSITSSIGNAHVELSKERGYINYRRMLFLNLWIAGLVTVCLYCLIDEFIVIWLGKEMLLDKMTVLVLCVHFFLGSVRKVNSSYVDACGLFAKDRIRPLIESFINLVVSILLVLKIGISGVFIGTIISHVCTVFWREPYILFKYEFRKKTIEYWSLFGQFCLITAGVIVLNNCLKYQVLPLGLTLFEWLMYAMLCFILYNGVAIMICHKREEFIFFKTLIKQKLCKEEK